MQNIVFDMCEKFHNDRLRNNRALVHWKCVNNNNNNNNNNDDDDNNNDDDDDEDDVGSAWGPVSGSKKTCECILLRNTTRLINNNLYTLCRPTASWQHIIQDDSQSQP